MSDSWRDEFVTKGAAFKVVEDKMESLLKQFGYDSYEEANEKIKLAYDGMMDALTAIYDMPPSVQQNDIQVAATNYANGFTDGYNAGKRDAQLEHTMEEFMYGQDLGNPEDGSL